jgi:hypothetical protein
MERGENGLGSSKLSPGCMFDAFEHREHGSTERHGGGYNSTQLHEEHYNQPPGSIGPPVRRTKHKKQRENEDNLLGLLLRREEKLLVLNERQNNDEINMDIEVMIKVLHGK